MIASGIFASIQRAAKKAPRASDPVSPINILAGWVLNNKKILMLIIIQTTKAALCLDKKWGIMQQPTRDIMNVLPSNPSRPSVRLVALDVATSRNTPNTNMNPDTCGDNMPKSSIAIMDKLH